MGFINCDDDKNNCFKKELINKSNIINFYSGKMYNIYFSNLNNLVIKETINKILDKFNFIPILKEQLLNKL